MLDFQLPAFLAGDDAEVNPTDPDDLGSVVGLMGGIAIGGLALAVGNAGADKLMNIVGSVTGGDIGQSEVTDLY